jgi:hypothetical protein
MKTLASIVDTPLPKGYSTKEIYLRTWLLNYRLKMECNNLDRAKMLDSIVYKFCRKVKNGPKKSKYESSSEYTRKLAKSICR